MAAIWRSLWQPANRFSAQELKYLISELRGVEAIDKENVDFVANTLRSIVEIVTYGDQYNPSIFECFMEYQVLADFLRVLKISHIPSFEVLLLQYMSIMIQNLISEHAIYYCFSNDYINKIILYPYKLNRVELAPYYVSFLRTVSRKLNNDTICLLLSVEKDVVVSFPLYTEAIKFALYEEQMIQTAARALILRIYQVSDDMVSAFFISSPMANYFSDLVRSLRKRCFNLDNITRAIERDYSTLLRKKLLLEADEVMDDVYYIKDIHHIGNPHLSSVMIKNLWSLLVYPFLLPALQSEQKTGSQLSARTSLYIVCRILQIVDAKDVVQYLIDAVICPTTGLNCNYNAFNIGMLQKFNDEDHPQEDIGSRSMRTESSVMEHQPGQLTNSIFSQCCNIGAGIFSLPFSETHSTMLLSSMLLLVLSETKAFSGDPSSIPALLEKFFGSDQVVAEIQNLLLKFLVNQPPLKAEVLWNIGWILGKLIILEGNKLSNHGLTCFNIAYKESCEKLLEELHGCWLDYILLALKIEGQKCRTALMESSHSKDPLFGLDVTFDSHVVDDDTSSSLAWSRMVYVVKVFVLQHLLSYFILHGVMLEHPFPQLRSSLDASGDSSGMNGHEYFASELCLGAKIPCRIALSKKKEIDVYVLPVAKGFSGKLVLINNGPSDSGQVRVIAETPLAGLQPRIDDSLSIWLHLRVRSYRPKLQFGIHSTQLPTTDATDDVADGRWILGFSNSEECRAAQEIILKEMQKQRSYVQGFLVPLVESSSYPC